MTGRHKRPGGHAEVSGASVERCHPTQTSLATSPPGPWLCSSTSFFCRIPRFGADLPVSVTTAHGGSEIMSVRVDRQRLRLDMDRRGLSATQLAREAKLSIHTVRTAMAGKRISSGSLRLIDAVLDRH